MRHLQIVLQKILRRKRRERDDLCLNVETTGAALAGGLGVFSVKELSGFMLLPVGEDVLPVTAPLHLKAALKPFWSRFESLTSYQQQMTEPVLNKLRNCLGQGHPEFDLVLALCIIK